MKSNKGKSAQDLGYVRESLYAPGEFERKDEWGNVVSHQDSKTLPIRDAYCDMHEMSEGEC